MDTDEFGIAKLHPTVGREWVSKWHTTPARTVTGRARDEYDAECEFRGTCPVVATDGAGVARVGGTDPRVYVYDRARPKWGNVEVTVYARRLCELAPDAVHQGFIVGARSEHQDVEKDGPRCPGTAYYGRVMYATGRADFKKELGHMCYTPARGRQVPGWEGGVPPGVWVGLKFVVRDTPAGGVLLELYRDLTDGVNGGTWEPLAHTTDAGDWPTPAADYDCTCYPAATVLTGAGTSVFLRNTLAVTDYRRFSVREIAAAPGLTRPPAGG